MLTTFIDYFHFHTFMVFINDASVLLYESKRTSGSSGRFRQGTEESRSSRRGCRSKFFGRMLTSLICSWVFGRESVQEIEKWSENNSSATGLEEIMRSEERVMMRSRV